MGAPRPTRALAGSHADFYAANPGDWDKEVAREEEDWDFFVPADVDELAAYTVVEAYIKECLEAVQGQKKKKKGKKQYKEDKAATKIQSKFRQKQTKQVAVERKLSK